MRLTTPFAWGRAFSGTSNACYEKVFVIPRTSRTLYTRRNALNPFLFAGFGAYMCVYILAPRLGFNCERSVNFARNTIFFHVDVFVRYRTLFRPG